MPRSPAAPRKGGGPEEDQQQMVQLNKLDSIRQQVEQLGERIQNFKVREKYKF
jgi:hypothetical protein